MQWLVDLSRFDLFLVDVSLKAGVILGTAWGISLALSLCRSSASSKHAVWNLAIVSVLGLPLMTAMLPTWTISMPWQRGISLTSYAPTTDLESEPLLLTWAQAEENSLVPTSEPQIPSSPATASTDEVAPAASKPLSRSLPNAADFPWLLNVWILGNCLTLAPALIGLFSLWRLGRGSRLVTTGPQIATLRQLTNDIGMKCSVRLLVSRARSMPMTWGIWRPTIVIPDDADGWSDSRLRIVLLHELAHFERRDCLTRLLAQIARAIYWFNPLAWLADRQLRTLQEQACDDLVLNRGFDAADYAEQLLAISAGYRSPVGVAGLASAMARASKLERRMLLILDPCQNRRPIPRRWNRFAAAAVLALLSALSAVRFEATAGEQVSPTTVEKVQPNPGAGQQADRSKSLAALRAQITEQYVTPVDEKQIDQGAIKGMIEALDDPYSDYLTPEMLAEMDKQIGGTLVGIGAQLEMHDGQIRVVTPLEDSPALKAGIQPGDEILQIDGVPTAGIELTEAVKRIVGQQGTVVRLNIGREGGQKVEINVTRNSIKVPTVKGFRRRPENRRNFFLDATQKIGYAQIAQLGTATPQELRAAVESLKAQGLKGLILDLRFCPGGTLESAIAVAKLFLSEGTIVSIHGRNSEPTPIKVDTSAALGDFPMIVLVNGETASAAEIVAGALQDNQRALVMGTRTVGKGSVQTLIKLERGGGAIKLTTSEYRLPSGRNIDRRGGEKAWGINPDEGYFVAVDQAQSKTLLERRQARDVIGKRSDNDASSTAEVTAEWIEKQQADPQLAAALRTMSARLASGQFAKVSTMTADEIEQFLKREDIERRRVAVLQNLEQLTRELAELDKEVSQN